MRLHTVVAVVYSAGSFAAVPCPDVVLASRVGMDLRLGFHQGIHRSRDSWAVGGTAVAAAAVVAIVLGLVAGNAAVLAAAHIAVSQAVVHSDAVYWHLRLVEGGSVAVDAPEEMWVEVGRIGRREGARSIVVVVVVGLL